MYEHLEQRNLLAGVTILAHGLNGNINGWIDEAADGIAERLGGPGAMSVYTMEVGSSGVKSFEPDDGYGDYMKTTTGELVIRVDWNDVSGNPVDDPTDEVAEDIANYLLAARTSKKLPPIAELPLHLVGHSRGGSLATEIAKYLGRRNVLVDQVTYLDPVAAGVEILGRDFGDPQLRNWDNVVFYDNYWRTDGKSNLDPDGSAVSGSLNNELKVVQDNFTISAHNAVTAYYVGTVDVNATDGGDHPIRSVWYQNGNPARDATGYAYSRIGGLARPGAGLGPLGRGTAERRGTGDEGLQWPGAVEVKPRGGTEFIAGQDFSIALRGGDRDDEARVTLFLDADRNPYNGAGAQIGSARMSGAVTDRVYGANAAGVAPGTYALAARMTDGAGQTRWFYGKSIKISAAPVIGEIVNRVLQIEGTGADDVVALKRVNADTISASRAGFTNFFARSAFDRIEIQLGDGNDTLLGDAAMPKAIYAFGDTGNDSLTGSGASDTLSGGAGRNFLDGGDGEDRLNGSGGADTLHGGNGDDRLYGNGGNDSFEGGGGINRLFGGDGNDFLVGGSSNDKIYGEAGNDTLIGRAGADILDGGSGTDTADDDDADSRTSIEALL